jgi:anti-sigma B factor antagonist
MIQEFTDAKDHILVTLSGRIYAGEAARLRASMLDCIEKGRSTFIVDLSGVDYIDSAGLGTLVAIQNRALKKDGRVIIKGIHGVVKDLFELTRLNFVFEIQ